MPFLVAHVITVIDPKSATKESLAKSQVAQRVLDIINQPGSLYGKSLRITKKTLN